MRRLFYRLRNLKKWSPIIWDDVDWDWTALARIMEFKLRNMAAYEEKYGHHVTSDLDAKRQRICAELLRRLREDEYDENLKKVFPHPHYLRFAVKQAKTDQEYLGRLIGKYFTHWWD